MDEIAIEKHSFEQAKNRLKEFSEQTEDELKIKKVKENGGFFGLGHHKVTGSELNERLGIIQKHFIEVNTINNKVIKEFREVYNALDALDKDYITSIVTNVKAIEKTSNDVRVQQGILKQHNEKLDNQQRKLDAHQTEIEKSVANISKIVTALKVFKEKLEEYKHLTDIDIICEDLDVCKTNIEKMNEDIQIHQKELITLAVTGAEHKEFIDTLFKNLAEAEKYAVDSRNLITELETFRVEVSALNHLMEIDETWKRTEDHQIRINRVEQEGKSHTDKLNELIQADMKMRESIDSNESDINGLKEYRDKLGSISHLEDVDNIWKDVKEHTTQLIESERKDESLAAAIQKNKEEVDKNIADTAQTINAAIGSLTKKVKYAYWIAGGSAGLAIIELILLLMKGI